MTGPFEQESDARASVQGIYRMAPGIGWTEANQRYLDHALARAGVPLGSYDHQIIRWLAGWEPSTVAVVAGWVTMARRKR